MAGSYGVLHHPGAAWIYHRTFPEFAGIRGWPSFHPAVLQCWLDEERASPQPGGYYGGWVTERLRGPIKGAPGTRHW